MAQDHIPGDPGDHEFPHFSVRQCKFGDTIGASLGRPSWVVIQGFGFETFSMLQTVTSCVLLNPQSFSSLDTENHSVFT